MKILYTTKVTSTGGRNGHVESEDGALNEEVRAPKTMGGKEEKVYLNPETLFAAGYSACFGSALESVLKNEKIEDIKVIITAQVSLGKRDSGEFGLSVVMEIQLPGIERPKADDVVKKAHELCPYSIATRGNIDIEFKVIA